MSSITSKTQFHLPITGKNLKVEAKKLAGDKASYTWLVGTQKEQKASPNGTLIYRSIDEKKGLMTWLGHLGVPSPLCQDLLSHTQPPISILDFIEALTFSFSDPWGSPKTSVRQVSILGQPGQSGSLPSLGGREWKDYRGSDPEAVSLRPSHLDLVAIQEELLALVKAATTRGGHVPGGTPIYASTVLLTFTTQLALLFPAGKESRQVSIHDPRVTAIREMFDKFEGVFNLRDHRLRHSDHRGKRAVNAELLTLNDQLVDDIAAIKLVLGPLLHLSRGAALVPRMTTRGPHESQA